MATTAQVGAPSRDRKAGEHVHAWPHDADGWREIARCRVCGLSMLKAFIDSSRWSVRRVEKISFLDDRTVRRSVSVDYAPPPDGVVLRPDALEGQAASEHELLRVLPLAIMRRKSLVNFDLRDASGKPMPLLGLRESQAVTLAMVRAWAGRSLAAAGLDEAVRDEVAVFVRRVVCGDQEQLEAAHESLVTAPEGTPLAALRRDRIFEAFLDRFADNFLLYTLDPRRPGQRGVIKFSYDEPLTLRFRHAGYRPPGRDGPAGERPRAAPYYRAGSKLHRWERKPLAAALGWRPTLIRFPVPGAELAASYHVEVQAPPDVSIASAEILAGRPNDDALPEWSGRDIEEDGREDCGSSAGRLRRPSFDRITGGYPMVDLHVADVPVGSLSRAQVALQASTSGWLLMAVFSCALVTAALGVAAVSNPTDDAASGLVVAFTGGLVTVLARPDPHRMVTRLLSGLRYVAMASAVLAFASAAVLALTDDARQRWLLGILAGLAAVPAAVVSWAWWSTWRNLRKDAQESPWEQHWPRDVAADDGTPEEKAPRPSPNVTLAARLEAADHPYDKAVAELAFDEPAIRVASSEGGRERFRWTPDFEKVVRRRLLDGLAADGHADSPG